MSTNGSKGALWVLQHMTELMKKDAEFEKWLKKELKKINVKGVVPWDGWFKHKENKMCFRDYEFSSNFLDNIQVGDIFAVHRESISRSYEVTLIEVEEILYKSTDRFTDWKKITMVETRFKKLGTYCLEEQNEQTNNNF